MRLIQDCSSLAILLSNKTVVEGWSWTPAVYPGWPKSPIPAAYVWVARRELHVGYLRSLHWAISSVIVCGVSIVRQETQNERSENIDSI